MSKTNWVSEVLTQLWLGGAAITGGDYSAQIMGGRTLAYHRSLEFGRHHRTRDQVTATLVTPHPPATHKRVQLPTNGASHKISADRRTAGSEVITLEELAYYLRISKSTVYRCVRLGQLPAFRVGRQWRVNLKVVQDHLIESYERKTGSKESPC